MAQKLLDPTLKKAWHAVDREGAERLLLKASVGSYLFRKDRFASGLEEILTAAKKTSLHCYTLSYLDSDHQVRDKTLVTWNHKWQVYDDDPSLTGRGFSSLDNLLQSLGSILKHPLSVG